MNPAILSALLQSGVVTEFARPSLYKVAMAAAQNPRTPVWALQAIQKWKDADVRTFGPARDPDFSLDTRDPNLRANVRRYFEQDPAIAKFRARMYANSLRNPPPR